MQKKFFSTYLNLNNSDIICDGTAETPQKVQKLPKMMQTKGM